MTATTPGPSSNPTPDRVDIGMCFQREFPASAVTEFAQALERGGVDQLWLIEDCFYTTAPPLAAAAAAVTERLTVGLGILPAVARTAPITAMEIATLAGIAPGRVIGGIGHGVQRWMAQMGVATRSPLTTLDEVLTAVRRLLRGETVTVDGREVRLDDVTLEHVPDPVPPVVAGVRGPKSLALAGRSADGVLLDSPCTPGYARWAREQCNADASFRYPSFALLCVEPDRATAYRTMAPVVADFLDDRHAGILHHPYAREMQQIRTDKGIDGLARMPADWWHQLGAVGTLDDATGYVAAMRDAGVSSVSFFPSTDVATARQQVDDVIALARTIP